MTWKIEQIEEEKQKQNNNRKNLRLCDIISRFKKL